MGLRILHTADWHLGSPFLGFEPVRRQFLRTQQLRLPELAAEICQQERCDLMLLAGDIFDGTPTRSTVEALKRGLAQCGVPVFLSPGNHDFCRPGSPWLEESWPENVHIFTGAMESIPLPELDCRVWGAGYTSMDCPGLLQGFEAEGEEAYRIAVLHGDPLQLHSPCCPVNAAQVKASRLTYLALGHIHKSGSFRAGSTLCAWPGCPMGRGWDETGTKGFFLAEQGETASVRFLPLELPQFYDLTVPVGEDAGAALEAVLPAAKTNDFYRVTLTGTGPVNITALKQKYAHLTCLEFRDQTKAPIDMQAEAEEDTLRGVFFRMLREEEERQPESTDVIRLAAELSHLLLEGKEVTLP